MPILTNALQALFTMGILCLWTLPLGLPVLKILPLQPTSRLGRWSLSIALGLILLPVVYYLVGVILTPSLPLRLLIWVIVMRGVWWQTRAIPLPVLPLLPPRPLILISLTAIFLTALPLVLHNFELAGNWYHVMAGDWVKHVGVGNALYSSDQLPPPNPFVSTEPHLRYYYFAYILPSMVTQLTGTEITVTNSLIGSALLLAGIFPFLVYDYGKKLNLSSGGAIFASFLVTLVGGLDLLYVLREYNRTGLWVEHIDFWANHDLRRINDLSAMFIWTPQHVLGVIGFLLVVWLLPNFGGVDGKGDVSPSSPLLGRSESAREGQLSYPYPKIPLILIFALLLTGIGGSSSFVWFGIWAGLGAWGLWLFFQRQWQAVIFLGISLGLSLLLSYPYLHLVGGREEAPFRIEISPTVAGWEYGGFFSQQFGGSPLTYALDFPFQMTVEFGAVFILGFWGLWLTRKNRDLNPLWGILLVVFMVIVLAVRPDRADSNNYAARVAPLAWLGLSLFSGFVWMHLHTLPRPRQVLAGVIFTPLILLGLAASVYESWIEQAPNYLGLAGQETRSTRQNYVGADQYRLYEWLDEHLERDEIYQIGWESGKATYFVQRRAAIAEGYLALLYISQDTLFYIDEIAAMELGFNSLDPQEAAAAFHHVGIDYMVLNPDQNFAARLDPAFADYFTLVYENPTYHAYRVKPTEFASSK